MNYLVTGCSRGLGLEICKILLDYGHCVFGVSRSYSEEFNLLYRNNQSNLFFLDFDLSNVEEIKSRIFNSFVSNKIKLNGFVNNAAIAYDDIVSNINVNKLKFMYSINVFSPFVITKYVIRNFLLHKTQGSIVHISSISAHTGYKGLSMYASSKGAIEAFSRTTAREWGNYGIRSNVVVPGFMETAMSSSLLESQRQKIYQRTSLKKATDVRSVAEAVCFLLSEKANSITGQNVHVDNGTI